MNRHHEGAEELSARLGANIRAARRHLGMTQGQLAGEDITRNMLSLIESGAALPSLPTLCMIAERLGLTPGALMGELSDHLIERSEKELRVLLAKKKYGELIDRWDRELGEDSELEPTPGLCDLLIEGLVGRAIELFGQGRLGEARGLLDRADTIPDPKGYDVSSARENSLTYRILISRTLGDSGKNESESLTELLFSKHEQAFYAVVQELLSESARRVRSEADGEAVELRKRLEPYLAHFESGLIRDHIEAKLLMIEAEYLSAKAKLLPLCTEKLPPGTAFELYSDLEHCCKCCGDFENAYKYSTEKLKLLQSIKSDKGGNNQ